MLSFYNQHFGPILLPVFCKNQGKEDRPEKLGRWQIHEKETIDEIIFRTTKIRNRLMLELMARGGKRVGEVLKLNVADVDDQRLVMWGTSLTERNSANFFFCNRIFV